MPSDITITADAAVRGLSHDRPVSLAARSHDGRLIGSAIACRAPMAIAYFEALEQGMSPVEYESELDSVSFLERLEVADGERGRGIATALLNDLELRLVERGTRVLFGGIARHNSVATAAFFEKRGFQVLQSGQRLPGFFGRRWTLPHTAEPHHWVFARLPRT